MKTRKILLPFFVLLCLMSFGASQALAQYSFKEVAKMRKEEEKNRAKLAKKNAKNKTQQGSALPVNEDNTWQNDKNKKAPASAPKGKKHKKKHVPKAAQNLSKQRQNVGKNTQKYRTGDKGLTKAAQSQRKDAKRKKRSEIEVW